jgi:mono/diheme cytochrome c family protein
MPVFLLKSILSLFIALSALFAMFTMFEVFGRGEKKFNVNSLKKLHRANGIFFVLLYMAIAYLCLKFVSETKAELSPRGAFHSVFAVTVIVLFALKVSFLRFYRQFYNQARTLGLLIALVTFGMVGTSAGYYLIVSEFGKNEIIVSAIAKKEDKNAAEEGFVKITLRTDDDSIRRGREMYETKCFSCHDPNSTMTIVGPGHKGILKNSTLPVGNIPSTPENVARQIRNPINQMPSFDYLTDNEVEDIISYLNTL